jgi:hypothetical protein
MDRLEIKLDKIEDEIGKIRESQIRTEADVKYHILRTDLLEEKISTHEVKVSQLIAPMPLKEKLQIGAFVAAIATALAQLLKQMGL